MFRDQRIAHYLAGDLTPAERAAFERDILSDPEGLAELVAQKCVDEALRSMFDPQNQRVESAIMATVRSVSEESAANRILADTVRAPQKRRFRQETLWSRWNPARWSWMFRTATACVLLMLGLGAWILFRPAADVDDVAAADDDGSLTVPSQDALKGFARLTGGAGVVWTEDEGFGIGSSLSAAKVRLRSGVIGIDLTNGVSIVLEGPAELDLISPMKSALVYGKLTAKVPTPAHGFTVDTGDAEVTDLGTAFGINRPVDGPLEVHVFTGKVEVTPRLAAPVELAEGKALRITAAAVTPLPADRMAFVTDTELQQRQRVELSVHYDAWRKAAAELDRDPSLLVHYDFQDVRGSNVVNHIATAFPETSGAVAGCEWGSGRWPGKGALQFSDRGDRVRLKVPGRFDSLTYIMWVSLDGLDRPLNALAMSQTFKAGEVQWDITASGIIQFSVRTDNDGGLIPGSMVSSPRLIKPKWFNRWIQLAAVYDQPGGKIDLYLNGERVATRGIDQSVPLVLEDVQLGNWDPLLATPGSVNERRSRERPSYKFRDFQGSIDEFVLLSRPLSGDEIRHLYEAGRARDEQVGK